MNRENEEKTFERGYYKTHACRDSFTCRVCGRLVRRRALAASTAIIARTAFPACMWTRSRATAPRIAAA